MNRRTPTVDPGSFGGASSEEASDLLGDLPGADADAPLDTTASAGEHPADPDGSLLIPTIWQRFLYWAWHPVSRSSLAVLIVAGLLPLLLSFTQHLTSAADVTGPTQPVVTQPMITVPITVPVTIAVPVTVTSTPPIPTTGTAAAPAPVTVVRTTVLTTVQTTVHTTGGTKPAATTSAPRPLVGPNVGAKAVICFTPATLEITATGKGVVNLNVTGAATAHKSGRGSAKLTVTGRTGAYAITYAATGGHSTIKWSALQGACS